MQSHEMSCPIYPTIEGILYIDNFCLVYTYNFCLVVLAVCFSLLAGSYCCLVLVAAASVAHCFPLLLTVSAFSCLMHALLPIVATQCCLIAVT